MQAPVSSGMNASSQLMPDRRIECGNGINARDDDIERAVRVSLFVHHVAVIVADGSLANAVAVDELESAQGRAGEGGTPSGIATNLDAQGVAVNAGDGVGEGRYGETPERRPDHGDRRQIVVHAAVRLLRHGELITDEQCE